VVALFLTGRFLLLAAPFVAGFVLYTALLSAVIETYRFRFLLGVLGAFAAPLFFWWRIAEFLKKRKLRGTPSPWRFGAAWNVVAFGIVAFGFADDVGRALRRHGDWFVGERHGAVARSLRSGIGALAAYFEKFDPPPELAPVVIPPDPAQIPLGPWRPGETPPEARPTIVAWFHPLAGPRRALPITEGRRFGAVRPPPRPVECELGHCGVDLGTTTGEPVFATFDGVIERIELDEVRGGRAGRYIRIGHKDGTVVTRYIHLDSVRAGLHEGDRVKGGELIGRLGRTGVQHSGAHLHFALSMRPAGRGGDEHYIDPEPMLRVWQLPDPNSALTATAMR
jgi:murein DD-endopeptidase MepM/ murein hydrolase activator NlpD